MFSGLNVVQDLIHFYFSLLQVVPGLLQLAHKSFQLCFTEEDDQDDEMDDKDGDEMDDDEDGEMDDKDDDEMDDDEDDEMDDDEDDEMDDENGCKASPGQFLIQ